MLLIFKTDIAGTAMEEARRRRPTLILVAEEHRSTLLRRQAQPHLPLAVTLMDRHKDPLL